MNRIQFVIFLLVAWMGVIIGGGLTNVWTTSVSVGQERNNGVNAQEFLLLDQSGKARAGLGLDPKGEVGLVLTSRDGNRTLALSPDGPVAIKLSDRSGRVLWSAP